MAWRSTGGGSRWWGPVSVRRLRSAGGVLVGVGAWFRDTALAGTTDGARVRRLLLLFMASSHGRDVFSAVRAVGVIDRGLRRAIADVFGEVYDGGYRTAAAVRTVWSGGCPASSVSGSSRGRRAGLFRWGGIEQERDP